MNAIMPLHNTPARSFMVLAHVAFGKLNAAWLVALNEFIRLLVPTL